MIVLMILNSSEMFALHISRDTAIFNTYCCQFGPSWIYGLEIELMTCADLVSGTMDQNCIITDLSCIYFDLR